MAQLKLARVLRSAPTGLGLERWTYSWSRPIVLVGILEDAVDSLGLMPAAGSYPDAIRSYPADVLSEAIEAAEALGL